MGNWLYPSVCRDDLPTIVEYPVRPAAKPIDDDSFTTTRETPTSIEKAYPQRAKVRKGTPYYPPRHISRHDTLPIITQQSIIYSDDDSKSNK